MNVALGISIDCHYCTGKLVDFKFYGSTKCNSHEGKMSSGCCKDVVHFCKTDSHQSPAVVTVIAPETSLKSHVFLNNSFNSISLITIDNRNNIYLRQCEADPEPPCPLFIYNQVFRI